MQCSVCTAVLSKIPRCVKPCPFLFFVLIIVTKGRPLFLVANRFLESLLVGILAGLWPCFLLLVSVRTCFCKLLAFVLHYRQGWMSFGLARQNTYVSDWLLQVTSGLRVVVLGRALWGGEYQGIGSCALGHLHTLPSCSCAWYVLSRGLLKGQVSVPYASHCPHCVVLAVSNKAMYPDPISYHSCHWDKISVKSSLKHRGFIWLTVGGYKPSWWQEPMAVGHFATPVRKQRASNAGHFPLPTVWDTGPHHVNGRSFLLH